jgi:hypothetical protein
MRHGLNERVDAAPDGYRLDGVFRPVGGSPVITIVAKDCLVFERPTRDLGTVRKLDDHRDAIVRRRRQRPCLCFVDLDLDAVVLPFSGLARLEQETLHLDPVTRTDGYHHARGRGCRPLIAAFEHDAP